MDALLFMVLTLFIVIREISKPKEVVASELIESTITEERVAKLNDAFFEDPNAFSEIINALGFPKE